MLVTDAEFERQVARAAALSPDPRAGLFGPGSMVWRACSESIVFLGAGRAALMQLAHPYVAHAIEQHSRTRTDPIGRFHRTFQNVYAMVFGDLDAAVSAARRVRRIHERITGSIDETTGKFEPGHSYRANDAEALFWVHATLLDTTLLVYQAAHGPLSGAELDAYVREVARFAWLFGVPDELTPGDWPSFQAMMNRVIESGAVAVGRPARDIARYLLTPPPGLLFKPALRAYGAITAGLLPPRLREAFELPWGPSQRLACAAALRAVRVSWPRIPSRLRRVPDHVEAVRRLDGKPREDRAGRALQDALLRRLRPPVAAGEAPAGTPRA